MFFLIALATLSVAQAANYKCHGDIMTLSCTGASARTAAQDRLSGGVASSRTMVTTDLKELNKRKSCYTQAGANSCIQPAVIAAIASRETRGGALLYRTGGYGDGGRAYGIMQCDGAASGLGSQCKQYAWDSCAHIDFMTKKILVPFINQIKSRHSSWSQSQALKGGISAYNAGPSNVQSFNGMDIGTTGNDYSHDVCSRAQYLISHYGWS